MNNDFLLSIVLSVIPILGIAFVVVLLILKVYFRIRSNFNASVNCWFCNHNTRVPYLDRNSWNCPSCEQYNGFTKDGDYNKELIQQFDSSKNSSHSTSKLLNYSAHSFFEDNVPPPLPKHNGFCNVCNEAQRLKVEKLAQFEPKNEAHFDAELKKYKAQLENQYGLCSTCDRHLHKVLREKKKMVLGSKFLDFIIKSAESIKQPHFNQLRIAQRQKWKRRITFCMTIFTLINLCCLTKDMPTLTRDEMTKYFGKALAQHLFVIFSHILALGRVVSNSFFSLAENAMISKFGLFMRTIFMMILYSMGLKLPQLRRFDFSDIFVQAYPFMALSLAFGHNLLNGLKLTRYTLLLVLWSVFAGGFVQQHMLWCSHVVLLFVASLFTVFVSSSTRIENSPKLHDNTANSFHKIYSEDYLSDDETMSLISQHMNGTNGSVRSNGSLYVPSSARATNGSIHSRLTKSPVTSSRLTLSSTPLQRNTPFSPNSSFKSLQINDNRMPMNLQYAASNNFNNNANNASTFGLNYHEMPRATSAFGATMANNSFSSQNGTFIAPQPAFSCQNGPFSPLSNYNNNTFINPKNHTLGFNSLADGNRNDTLTSPISASNRSIYQQRTSNLLTPSRLSTLSLNTSFNNNYNHLNKNAPATSWLSGGYFNQHQVQIPQEPTVPLGFDKLTTNIDEKMSRTSSQSSGFESQSLNGSRENSFGPENDDLDGKHSAFRPIATAYNASQLPNNSAFFSTNHTKPLTVNCSNSEISWKAPLSNVNSTHSTLRRADLSNDDLFNFRKFNDELRTLRRGTFLKLQDNPVAS